MTGIVTEIAAGATAAGTRVYTTGEQDLGVDLGFGGVQAAIDEWQAQRGDKALPPYQLQQTPGQGNWGRGWAKPVHAAVDDTHLIPTGLRTHIWDNLKAPVANKFSTSLEVTETVEDSVSTESKLTIGASFTSTVKVTGGPVSASGSATFSATAEVGKTWSQSRSLSVGSTDAAEAELPPGVAELLVLSSLKGPLAVVSVIQTEWRGSLQWRYGSNHPWQTVNLDVLEQHGLARPFDQHGMHNGLVTVTTKIGTVSEVDQTAVALAATDPGSVKAALEDELASRWPDRQPQVAELPPSLGSRV